MHRRHSTKHIQEAQQLTLGQKVLGLRRHQRVKRSPRHTTLITHRVFVRFVGIYIYI